MPNEVDDEKRWEILFADPCLPADGGDAFDFGGDCNEYLRQLIHEMDSVEQEKEIEDFVRPLSTETMHGITVYLIPENINGNQYVLAVNKDLKTIILI